MLNVSFNEQNKKGEENDERKENTRTMYLYQG